MSNVAVLDTLRTLAFGSISGTYAAVGAAVAHPIRLICFTNNTDADMFFSDDGVNNKIFVAKGSFKLFDITTNRDNYDSYMALRAGTQFYVKQSSAPGSGAVYIEIIYGYS